MTRPFYSLQVQGPQSKSLFKVIFIEIKPQNFNIGRTFWLVRVRAFIFHMSIPCDKTVLLAPSSRTSVKAKVSFHDHTHMKWNFFYIGHNFWIVWHGPLFLTCEFIVTRLFCSLQVQSHQSESVFKVILMQNANFNIGHNFWMVWYRVLIFDMWIPCDRTLMIVPSSKSSVKVMVKYQGHSF